MQPLPNLGPFDVGVAGIGEHGDARFGDVAHWMFAAGQLHRHIGFNIAANIR